jgi:hypothetical protein
MYIPNKSPVDIVEYKKYKSICDLYRKQNRFNPFSFLDHRYKNYIECGKIARIWAKIVFISIFLFIPILFTHIIISSSFFIFFMVSIILSQYYDNKYESHKDQYYFEKKTNPNFYRKQKLKRILNIKI